MEKDLKKTATCRNFVHVLLSGQHTKLSTLCSNVVAMWSRVDQGPGIHERCYICEKYFQHVLTVWL